MHKGNSLSVNKHPPKPLLVFDGDCGFCRDWVNAWQKLTLDKVDYAAYQEVADQFAEIPAVSFASSIQYIDSDGTVTQGAKAAFQLLANHPNKKAWLWCYRFVPGFAGIADMFYRFISRNRPLASRFSRLLWGRNIPVPHYDIVSGLFLRLIGLFYLIAFFSFNIQAQGLIGSKGILPLTEYLDQVRDLINGNALTTWLEMPILFWLSASDMTINLVCYAGIVLSLFVIAGVYQRICLIGLFVLYLSLFYAGQVFTTFQWDLLLLESGFLAIFLPMNPWLITWLYRWLVFRFMFLAGFVKVASSDQSWLNLTALHVHFQTEPLPNPLAWYAHHLPEWLHRSLTVATLLIELIIPFFIFLPRRLRQIAAISFLLLQIGILITGNFNFFNLLTITLCLFLLDDQALQTFSTRLEIFRIKRWRVGKLNQFVLILAVVFVVFTSGLLFYQNLSRQAFPDALKTYVQQVSPFRIVNDYGVFAHMTTVREEIIIEGSMDGQNWQPYEFKYKPGDTARAPRINIPHQPRLDWQMWFAALGTRGNEHWFENLLQRLLENEPNVTKLLAINPFTDQPPISVRAMLYEYRYTTAEEKSDSGDWWVRELRGVFYPPISNVTLQQPRKGIKRIN